MQSCKFMASSSGPGNLQLQPISIDFIQASKIIGYPWPFVRIGVFCVTISVSQGYTGSKCKGKVSVGTCLSKLQLVVAWNGGPPHLHPWQTLLAPQCSVAELRWVCSIYHLYHSSSFPIICQGSTSSLTLTEPGLLPQLKMVSQPTAGAGPTRIMEEKAAEKCKDYVTIAKLLANFPMKHPAKPWLP